MTDMSVALSFSVFTRSPSSLEAHSFFCTLFHSSSLPPSLPPSLLPAHSISCGQALLFSSMFPRHKERLPRKVSEVAAEVAKLDLSTPRRYIDLGAACEDEDGEDLDVPLISIRYK